MIPKKQFTVLSETSRIRKALSLAISITVILLIIVSSAWYVGASQIPPNFPLETDVVISEGMTHREIGEHLENLGVVSSSFLFQTVLARDFAHEHVQAGTYHFTEPLDVRLVIDALVHGEYQTPLNKITFPEGFRVRDFSAQLLGTTSPETLDLVTQYEGRLFPDTYFVKKETTPEELVRVMLANYETRLAPIRERILESGFTEKEIIILASILEREANDETSMRMVSGVLHNRLSINMPLQVDAAFEYLLGKTSAELTASDLLIDSPYNTYTNAGLPPTPISNPGMKAIEAALNPERHSFLYYLTGNDGTFHYAKTFEEHKQNKARYLR